MASFSAGTTFTDGVANDVTAAKLAALVNAATPTSGLIQDRTAETSIASNDTLLFGDASASDDLKRITVANFRSAATFGTTTSTAATITSGTITTLNSTTGTITTGVIPTLTSTTLITTGTGTAASPAIVPTGDTNTGIFFPAADTIAFSEGGTESMRIDSSGNLLVGLTSPTFLAETRKSIEINGSTDSFIAFGAASSAIGYLYASASEARLYSFTNVPLLLGSNNTERLRIDSSGNVGIGTTSPASKLHVYGANTTSGGIRIQESTASVYRALYINGGSLYFYNGTNEGFLNSAGAWINASDARLKKNITDIEYGLNAVMDSKPRSFERIDIDGKYFGFVAQELQNVLPEAVNGDPERQLGVDYGSLVAVAFKAIQELKAKNDLLEARLEALEAK